MDEIEFLFIGWCCETEANGTKHDKVWTAFKVGNTYYAGWGKRGKHMSFKNHGKTRNTIDPMMRKKKKDYEEVDAFKLFAIFPYFNDEVSQSLMLAVLSEKIK